MRWVIVAHPDDEIIFAGGAILSHADEPWTVVVATWAEGSPRGAESLRARDELRSRGIDVDYRFLGHTDVLFHPSGGIDAPLLARQLGDLGIVAAERVYTHGAPGEYGHAAHQSVHSTVAQTLGGSAVVSTFSGTGILLEQVVDPALLARKIRIFNHAYPSQQGVWAGIPHTMLQVSRAESHFALASASRATPDSTGTASANALAEAVAQRLSLIAAQDALVVGLSPAIDLRGLQAQATGRIDVIDASPAAAPAVEDIAGARVVGADVFAWDPGDRSYDLVLWVGSLQYVPDLGAALERARRLLRPQGQMIFTHEPLIDGHPRQGRGHSLEDGVYRRPTQSVLEIARRNDLKVRLLKDLVIAHHPGPPVICQLAHLRLR